MDHVHAPALVPELLVESVAASLDVWCRLCGFEVYDRPEEGFAYIAQGSAPGWPLFMESEMRWYRTGDGEAGVEQFLVTDPDGYLLPFEAPLPDVSRR